MSDFDPKAFLAEDEEEFDPKAFLADDAPAPNDGVKRVNVQLPAAKPLDNALPSDIAEQNRPKAGFGKAAAYGAADLLSFGAADEVAGGARAAFDYVTGNAPDGLKSQYQKRRDESRAAFDLAEKDDAAGYVTGQSLSSLGGAGLAKKLPAALQGLKGMMAGGALAGAGSSRADLTEGEVGGFSADVGIGTSFGAAGGAVGKLASKLGEMVSKGIITPSDAAKFLRSKGVNLTLGQMNAGGKLSQLEEAATSVNGVGPRLTAQREGARQDWRNVVLNAAKAPKGRPVKAETPEEIPEAVEKLKGGYKKSYGVLKGNKVWADKYEGEGKWTPLVTDDLAKGSFERAADNNQIYATPEVRESVKNWLIGQAGALPKGIDTKQVPAEKLQKLRSSIRDEIRRSFTGSPSDSSLQKARLLENAEHAITEILEQQLPSKVAGTLKATDRKYGDFAKVLQAVANSGDKTSGFSPTDLSRAIKKGSNTVAYATNKVRPELRKLARTGKEVLDTRTPNTGSRLLSNALSGIPGGQRLPGWLIGMANDSPGAKSALLGETELQKGLQKFGRSTAGKGLGLLGDAGLRGGAFAGTEYATELRHPNQPQAQLVTGDHPAHVLRVMRQLPKLMQESPSLFGKHTQALEQARYLHGDEGLMSTFLALAEEDPAFADAIKALK